MKISHPDAIKWNKRYQSAGGIPTACTLLEQFQYLLPTKGNALDLASGLGGNALLLAKQGLTTSAWDISEIALDKLQQVADSQNLPITTEIKDIETQPITPNQFDCIVASYFLNRPLCAAIEAALKPGGLLFYQTFCIDKVSQKGPSSPRFLLKNNELLRLFPHLSIKFYQELGHTGNLQQGDRDTAQLIAQKPL